MTLLFQSLGQLFYHLSVFASLTCHVRPIGCSVSFPICFTTKGFEMVQNYFFLIEHFKVSGVVFWKALVPKVYVSFLLSTEVPALTNKFHIPIILTDYFPQFYSDRVLFSDKHKNINGRLIHIT